MKLFFIIAVNFIICCPLFAQTENDEAIESEEVEKKWSAELSTKWMSNYQSYGIERDNGTTFGGSAGISHITGFFTDFDLIYLADKSAIDNTTLTIGYDYELSDIFSISGEYSYTTYFSDTSSVFSSLNHGAGLSFDAELPFNLSLSLFFDHYFGNRPASYFGLSLSSFIRSESFYFIPILQTTFVSQDIEINLLKNAKKGKIVAAGSTKTVTGFSSVALLGIFVYPLNDQWKLIATPSFSLTPNADISTENTQFSVSVSLKYGLDF